MNNNENIDIIASRNYIKSQLLASMNVFRGYEKEKAHVTDLIERTVKLGESNSALLVGPRSSGKSALVENVLKDFSQHKYFKESAVVIRLNGLVHVDDSIALKSITSQMGLTNASQNKTFVSFAENLSFLLECLRYKNGEYSKSTIVILDEFDLFCSHYRQTLLYNLLDVAQSAEAPLCVLGLTCRLDATELLEKRVRSRFSNRQIYLFPDFKKCGFKGRVKLCQNLLSLRENSDKEAIINSIFVQCWNERVSELCCSSEVQNVIKSLYNFDMCERQFHSFLLLLLSRLNYDHPYISVNDFVEVHNNLIQDANVNVLESLSVLEVCLLIAMKHHTVNYDNEPFNFEMVFRAYKKFINHNSLEYTTDRAVIMKAFENIVSLELTVPIRSFNNSTILKEFRLYKLALTNQQIDVGINSYKNLPTEVSQWLRNSI